MNCVEYYIISNHSRVRPYRTVLHKRGRQHSTPIPKTVQDNSLDKFLSSNIKIFPFSHKNISKKEFKYTKWSFLVIFLLFRLTLKTKNRPIETDHRLDSNLIIFITSSESESSMSSTIIVTALMFSFYFIYFFCLLFFCNNVIYLVCKTHNHRIHEQTRLVYQNRAHGGALQKKKRKKKHRKNYNIVKCIKIPFIHTQKTTFVCAQCELFFI